MSVCSRLCLVLVALTSCAPAVTIKPAADEGFTVIKVRADAREVVLRGSMTNWRPLIFERRANAFELSLKLAPGRYEYRLEARDDQGIHQLFVEQGERTDDGFGSENSVLRIE